MRPFDPRDLGKVLGIAKIANAIEPNIAMLKKVVNPPNQKSVVDRDGKLLLNAAQADAKGLRKGLMSNPPRRVNCAWTKSRSGAHCRAISINIFSTQFS